MKKAWVRGLAFAALALMAPLARAADHADGPNAKNAPESDITDVFTWVSADGTKTYFVVNVNPGATSATKFSDKVQFAVHINAAPAFTGDSSKAVSQTNIVCSFDTSQAISCWLGKASATGISAATDYVTGDASKTTGLASLNGKFKVFAGPRDDPFFFNFDGFAATAACVEKAAPGLLAAHKFDASGCPQLDAATATLLGNQLKGNPPASGTACDTPGTAPVDKFAGGNVMSIVMAVDTATLTGGTNKVLGVWASTHKKP